jgi:hypothetical protein
MSKLKFLFLFGIFLIYSQNAYSEYFLVDGKITAMIYKKGWLANKWEPESIDGLYIGKEKKPRPLPKNFESKIVTFFGSKTARKGSCRIEYRHLRGVWYWKKHWKKGKGKPFETEDYLKFNCLKY